MEERGRSHPPARADRPPGQAILRDPLLNKGTAFTEAERRALGLHGLLPPRVFTIEEQVERVMENYRVKTSDLERYIYLIGLAGPQRDALLPGPHRLTSRR